MVPADSSHSSATAPLLQPPQALVHGQLQLRPMQVTDLPGIMAIEAVSFGPHHWSADSFKTEMANQMGRYFVLVAANGETILGYCGAWVVVDEGHITTIAAHPNYRGQSLGEVLLNHLLHWLVSKKAAWATLEVRQSNLAAQNLYYKYGFISQGIRPKYYQDNDETALIMTTPNLQTSQYTQHFALCTRQLQQRLGGLPQGFGIPPTTTAGGQG